MHPSMERLYRAADKLKGIKGQTDLAPAYQSPPPAPR